MATTSFSSQSWNPDAYAKSGETRKVGNMARSVLMPAYQARSSNREYIETTRQLPLPGFSSTIFATAGLKQSAIPKIDFVKHVLLKVDLTIATAPMDIVPSTYWFSEIALKDSGSGQIVQRSYDDSAAITAQMRCAESKQRSLFKSLNLECDDIGKYGLAKRLPVGTHTFFIPIFSSIFENFLGLYLGDLQGELALVLTTPATIIANANGGTLTAALSLLVEGQSLTDNDVKNYKANYIAHAPECNFLQAHRSEFMTKTLTAGQVNKLALSSLDGHVAFQVLMVRNTGMTNDNGSFNSGKWLNLGDANGAAIDLTTSSGISILGNGAPVPTAMIRRHQTADNYNNDFFTRKPLYVVSYCQNPLAALAGVVDGGRNFIGQNQDELRITLPSAPVAEVQTITFSTAPAATGFYSFRFRGEQSAQILGNAAVGTIKSTIEAMREVAARGITVVASAVASAGTSFTLTITDPEGTLDGDLFTVNPHDIFGASASTARTTAGVAGLATGTYDVYVYSFVYSTCGYVNGKLRSQQKV